MRCGGAGFQKGDQLFAAQTGHDRIAQYDIGLDALREGHALVRAKRHCYVATKVTQAPFGGRCHSGVIVDYKHRERVFVHGLFIDGLLPFV